MIKRAVFVLMSFITCITLAPSNPASSSTKLHQDHLDTSLPPEKVIYEFLFRQVLNFELLAQQADRQSKDSTVARNYVRNLYYLDDDQANILKMLALNCMQQVEQLDDQAHQIIQQIRAQYPKGDLTVKKLPAVPPALLELQRQRDNLFLNARDTFQQILGERGFSLFEIQLKVKFSKNIQKGVPKSALYR